MPNMVYDRVKKMCYDSHCKGCVYLQRIGAYGGCHYIFAHGKSRPCSPGKYCTVKEMRK